MKKMEAGTNGPTKLLGLVLAVLISFALGGCGSDYDDDDDPSPSSYLALGNGDWAAGSGQAARIKFDKNGAFPAVQNTTPLDYDLGGMDISRETGKETAFLVGKMASTVYKLDPRNGMEVMDAYSVEPGATNPQDVLVVSESKAYVTRYDAAYDDILIIDPSDGNSLGTIDFTGTPTNGDSLARPEDMIMANGKVFVALQNLNAGFNYCEPDIEPGIVAVIDPATDTITDTIALSRSNPKRLYYSEIRNEVLVASAGQFATDSAGCPFDPDPDISTSGLEAFSASAPHDPYLIVSGDHPDINGNIYDVAVSDEENAYVLVAFGFKNMDRARRINLATGAVDPGFRYPPLGPQDDDLSGVQAAEGFLFIGDRANSGVQVIRTSDHKETGFHALDLPPITMTVSKK